MVRRALGAAFICLVALVTQVPAVRALSADQKNIFDEHIFYFNVDSGSNSCSDLTTNIQSSSSSSTSLQSIAQKYSLQSAIIEKVGGGAVDSYKADQPPNTPASTMKLIIADVAIRSGLNLDQSISVSGEEVYPSDVSYPDPTSIPLSTAMDKMLSLSSNTAANALMKAMGGVGVFTQKAHSYDYSHTTVNGYYNPKNDGKNSSTIGDEANAMNHIFSTQGEAYSTAQGYLVTAAKTDNPYHVADNANKYAETTTVAGNVGMSSIAGNDYVIGLYINKPPATDASAPDIIKNASADIANMVAAQNSGPNNGNSDVSTTQGSNTDYAGRSILNQGELQALQNNAPTYQQAASQVGIPWQVLAALHYREHDFLLTQPGNGQGVYQIVNPDKHTAGAYPPAGTQLTPDQFLSQSLDAANFVKKDGAGLGLQADTATIKDALVKYNGEPSQYIKQAQELGYASSQGYEGSPYVMNIADAPRDPSSGPISTWLQDFGGGNYQPATASQYGAYVVYTSISGQTLSGSCQSNNKCSSTSTQGLSTIRQNVVCIAQQELTKWTSGQLKPGTGNLIYSQNAPQDWCADFVSWVYDQANYPLEPDPGWRVPLVKTIKEIGQNEQNFHWHPISGYIPKPGDIAIHFSGGIYSHTNIVVGVRGNDVTLIGGNQGGGDFTQSVVSTSTLNSNIVGYVSPD
ncbi:MAG TPA: serine hydrolase [Candidatus Saccharimonadales bacterium]|nr:serine hydrolase [Candidatus Saccharimonadales bacterium]